LDKELYVGEGGPARYALDNASCKARDVAERVLAEESASTTQKGGGGGGERPPWWWSAATPS